MRSIKGLRSLRRLSTATTLPTKTSEFEGKTREDGKNRNTENQDTINIRVQKRCEHAPSKTKEVSRERRQHCP